MTAIPQNEVDDFNAACRVAGIDPERFTLRVVEDYPVIGFDPPGDRIEVSWTKTNGDLESEQLEARRGANWVATFIHHVSSGCLDLS